MSNRRGRNNVKRAIVNEARNTIFGGDEPESKVVTNNFNPLFHYLQTMFPNYDNAVLHAVLEQEGNSIERAIEVLLTFGDAGGTAGQDSNDYDSEIKFLDDFSDTEGLGLPQMATPIVAGTAAVERDVSGFNTGRDHVSLYEYQKRRRTKKSQRARRRQQAYQAKLHAAQQEAQQQKRVKWVPLQDFLIDKEDDMNPFIVLEQFERRQQEKQHQEPEEEKPAADECEALLTEEEIEESWRQFEEAISDDVEEASSDCADLTANVDWSAVDDALAALQPGQLTDASDASESVASSDNDDFVVIEQQQAVADAVPVVVEPKREQQVVVKIYYSASDIHRLGLAKSALTFAKLFEYTATYLGGKCQLATVDAPRAFALTYVDEEGDTISLCSEAELTEALRVHEDNFWTDGKQPILRLQIKPIAAATHEGHVLIA